jgi:hypothetical protein
MKTIKIYYNLESDVNPTKPRIEAIRIKNDMLNDAALISWLEKAEEGVEIVKVEVEGSPYTEHYDQASKVALRGTESQSKGGLTSSANMSASERSERAKKAAASRWNKQSI